MRPKFNPKRGFEYMTMGLKVRALFNDKELKKRAEARKAKSDAILESIYALLTDNDAKAENASGHSKKSKN